MTQNYIKNTCIHSLHTSASSIHLSQWLPDVWGERKKGFDVVVQSLPPLRDHVDFFTRPDLLFGDEPVLKEKREVIPKLVITDMRTIHQSGFFCLMMDPRKNRVDDFYFASAIFINHRLRPIPYNLLPSKSSIRGFVLSSQNISWTGKSERCCMNMLVKPFNRSILKNMTKICIKNN